jgi:hypothetical protein
VEQREKLSGVLPYSYTILNADININLEWADPKNCGQDLDGMFSWWRVHVWKQPKRNEVCFNLKHFHKQRNGTRQPANRASRCVASEILVGMWRVGTAGGRLFGLLLDSRETCRWWNWKERIITLMNQNISGSSNFTGDIKRKKKKVKWSRYTPWKRLGWEEV